jgi:hypothetical protein
VVNLGQDALFRQHALHLVALLHLPLVQRLHCKLQISALCRAPEELSGQRPVQEQGESREGRGAHQ